MSIKLEALFKLDYIIEKNNEKDIRNFLESKIDALEVHHIETFVMLTQLLYHYNWKTAIKSNESPMCCFAEGLCAGVIITVEF